MHLTRASKILLIYYIIIICWWAILFLKNIRGADINYYYQFAFGLIPLAGGVWGMLKSRKWGFIKSKVGAFLFFVSSGLIAWGIGQMFWSVYYNLILHVEVPYPSLADIGYISAIPLWTLGILYLSRTTGMKFALRKIEGKILFFAIILLVILFSYYLLIVVARNGVVSDWDGGYAKIFLDLAYPIGDGIILTLIGLVYGLSFQYLGGRYKTSILVLLIGFLVMYVVDFSFSYVTTAGTYYNGHWVDALFPTAMTLISLGINNFDGKT